MINTVMLKRTVSESDDPRETINWIWFHGLSIDFDTMFVAPEVLHFVTNVEAFRHSEETETPALRMVGFLFDIFVYEDLYGYEGMIELINHLTGEVLKLKLILN